MSAYTPGPWQVWPLVKDSRLCISTTPDHGNLVREICTVPDDDDANARLIVEAPEMVAELVTLNALIAAWRVTGKPDLRAFMDAQERIDAIVARVDGAQ